MELLIKLSLVGCTILMLFEGLEPLRRAPTLPPWAHRMSQYDCHLWRTCTPGGPQTCAWDELQGLLKWFDDICDMYLRNCESQGTSSFIVQHNRVCQLKERALIDKMPVDETDLPVIPTRPTRVLRGKNRTKEWWWQGSTTNQYQYLYTLEVEEGK
ncbi:uncharacterized protein LOC134796253 [Cydia splendana]|uniref:uncharacterized protein LOC134796253 n=1 Tax=Cydia splendana TaxID=1100963 RepID=UPI0028F48B0F